MDIGVHQDGLVHISHLADRFVKDPNEVVKVQQRVEVTVLEVVLPRKRIALSMRKGTPTARPAASVDRANPPVRSTPAPVKPVRKPEPVDGWFSAAIRQAKKN